MKKEPEIKVKVVYEEGYEQRFTDCCLAILRRKREAQKTRRNLRLIKLTSNLLVKVY